MPNFEDEFLINSPEFKRAKKLLENEFVALEKLIQKKSKEKNKEIEIDDFIQPETKTDNALVNSLNSEINNLQKTLAELGKENESLLEENRVLTYKISNIKKHAPELLKEIESDLTKIKNILKE